MAESSLSITFDQLAVEVAVFLGYSATKTDWSAAQLAEIDRYIQSGIRQFYYPPAGEGVPEGYEWSFAKPTTTLTVEARYTTGSLAVATETCTLTGGTWPAWAKTHGTLVMVTPQYTTGSLVVVTGTCTLTGGIWPTWAKTHGTLVIDSVTYTITTRDSDTELTVVGDDVTAADGDWSLSNDDDVTYAITTRDSDTELTVVGDDITAANGDWYLSHVGYQDLPDDLGRVVGDFHYAASEYKRSIVQTSEGHIKTCLSRTSDEAPPTRCTVRHRAQVAGEGQGLEVVWFPIPDDTYTLTYTYEAYAGKITTTDNPYPLGGMKFAELITESCLAIAEQRANDEIGLHSALFARLLLAGIKADRRHGATYFGPMSTHRSGEVQNRHPQSGSNYEITYDGETW